MAEQKPSGRVHNYGLVHIRPANRRRGGAATASRFAHVVDGQQRTTGQLARALGVSVETVRHRIQVLQLQGAPLTLAGLGTGRADG